MICLLALASLFLGRGFQPRGSMALLTRNGPYALVASVSSRLLPKPTPALLTMPHKDPSAAVMCVTRAARRLETPDISSKFLLTY